MHAEKLAKSTTTDGNPPAPGFENASAPQPVGPDGQHEAYWVLNEEERSKGWVRPLRRKYRHVGPAGPKNLRDLTPEEQEQYAKWNYVKFEAYDNPDSAVVGRYWTQAHLDRVGSGCGTVTTMGLALCETYAKDPTYYGSTFCCGCGSHFPVSEFRWVEDNQVVGT